MTKQEVLDRITNFTEDFPTEALEAIKLDRESFIPELLDSLDYVYRNSESLDDANSNYFLHNYAMYLLAEFREKRAFPLIVNLLKLPENELDFIFGDNLTEDFARLALSTFDKECIQMLNDIIEDANLDEWARYSAIFTYGILLNEKVITKEECISYLRSLIYDKLQSDDSEIVFTSIVGCVIDNQLVDMIKDARFLHDNNQVDEMMHGAFDGFIDCLFDERSSLPTYINDAISEMEPWFCYKNDNEVKLDRETTFNQKPKKMGRNDPCPCGSGKKYKKCCIHLQQKSTGILSLEDKYDLLKDYPKDSALFNQLYEKEAIDIDIFAYKALNHRAIPLWEKRDMEQERMGQINYLSEALKLFLDKCERENITSFDEYDERFMIHYKSQEWVSAIVDLVEHDDSKDIVLIERLAKETLRKFFKVLPNI